MSQPPQLRDNSEIQLPSSDRSWPRRCGPLLLYLHTPRTWGELMSWAHERGMSGCRLRNMLAWLEGEGAAGAFADRHPLDPGETRSMWRRYRRA